MNLTRAGVADGCFIDGATFPHTVSKFQAFEKWNISDAKASNYITGHDQALWTLNTALGEGTIIANGGFNALASGFMIESFTPDAYSEIQAGVKSGVVTQVHTSYYRGAKNPDVRVSTQAIESAVACGAKVISDRLLVITGRASRLLDWHWAIRILFGAVHLGYRSNMVGPRGH